LHPRHYDVIDLEINRLFKTNFFNSNEREFIDDKIKNENSHISNLIKIDKTHKMIKEWEEINRLPKYRKLFSE
jgi:hypothetical protein